MSRWCNCTIVLAVSSLPFVVHVTVNAFHLSKKKTQSEERKQFSGTQRMVWSVLGYCNTLKNINKKKNQQNLNSLGNLNLRIVLPSSFFAVKESHYVKFAFFWPQCPHSDTKVCLILNLTSFRVQAIPNPAFVAAKPGALYSSSSTLESSNADRAYGTALVQFVFLSRRRL